MRRVMNPESFRSFVCYTRKRNHREVSGFDFGTPVPPFSSTPLGRRPLSRRPIARGPRRAPCPGSSTTTSRSRPFLPPSSSSPPR
eukprot:31103-Pelagococcus_subviridis.AAC.1